MARTYFIGNPALSVRDIYAETDRCPFLHMIYRRKFKSNTGSKDAGKEVRQKKKKSSYIGITSPGKI